MRKLYSDPLVRVKETWMRHLDDYVSRGVQLLLGRAVAGGRNFYRKVAMRLSAASSPPNPKERRPR